MAALKKILEFIGTVPFQELNAKKLQECREKKKKGTATITVRVGKKTKKIKVTVK